MLLHFPLVSLFLLLASGIFASIPSTRPPEEQRTFKSDAIDSLIEELKPLLSDPSLRQLFENCFPNSLDTTIKYITTNETSKVGLDSFIITGDIEALWLRDSANQILPYAPYAEQDENLRQLFQGLIARHAKSILIDPFANAFNYNATVIADGDNHQDDIRNPPMQPEVFEGKYELDSLLSFLKVSYWYHNQTRDHSFIFTDDWISATDQVLTTIEIMMNVGQDLNDQPYSFQRETNIASDTLAINDGLGPPGLPAIGLSRSLFRPSDDAVTFPYNIPANAMACVEIKSHLVDLLTHIHRIEGTASIAQLRENALRIGSIICKSVNKVFSSSQVTEQPLPYEIDGFGSTLFMDDANVPSLLSLPVLGAMSTNSGLYQNTRRFVLSANNPFFFQNHGSRFEGVGGPHKGYDMVWPMAIMMRAMTSIKDEEIAQALDMIVRCAESTGMMHESFNVSDSDVYTRDWFAWANGMFGELILQLVYTHPHLVLLPGEDIKKKAQSIVKKTIPQISMEEAAYY